jgi:hypothetical protein
VTDLLVNLKRIFDDNLLVQSNFFADDTLLTAFNGRALRWITGSSFAGVPWVFLYSLASGSVVEAWVSFVRW